MLDVDRRLGGTVWRGRRSHQESARARGGADAACARCITRPLRRRIAPRLAPVRKRTPAIVSSTPRIVAPVVPSARATRLSSPHRAGPRGAYRASASDRSGRRRDRAGTVGPRPAALRDDQGAERDKDDRHQVGGRADRQSASCWTGPPLKPNQRIAARKTPSPVRPRPISSGWWCACALRRALLGAPLLDAARESSGTPCGAASCAPCEALRGAGAASSPQGLPPASRSP